MRVRWGMNGTSPKIETIYNNNNNNDPSYTKLHIGYYLDENIQTEYRPNERWQDIGMRDRWRGRVGEPQRSRITVRDCWFSFTADLTVLRGRALETKCAMRHKRWPVWMIERIHKLNQILLLLRKLLRPHVQYLPFEFEAPNQYDSPFPTSISVEVVLSVSYEQQYIFAD